MTAFNAVRLKVNAVSRSVEGILAGLRRARTKRPAMGDGSRYRPESLLAARTECDFSGQDV
jgi:hypothetical protein